jgi:hydroxymethylbilane synthase
MLVRVGSRGSRLALTQAELAANAIRGPGIEIALVPITTAGDRDRTKPFGEIGERGVFVKELEEALLDGRIDVAVHSAKDMTSTDLDGLAVGAYLAREDPRDALCGSSGIEPGMRIGTASIRRRAQLLALEPSLSIEPLRGNIDTRLRKRGERGLDAVVLAACGLDRLGLGSEIGHRFDPTRSFGGGPGRARSGSPWRGAPRGGGERCGDGAQSRARARLRGGDRRRLPRSDRGSSRRRDADGAHRRPGRPLGRAPHRRRPGGARVGAGRARRVKVVVTRPRAQAGPLVERLEQLGHEVVECPLIEIERTSDDPIDAEGYDWVVVTSPNGAASR